MAPAAVGPYAQAIAYGTTVYVSGQLPINPTTGVIDKPGDATSQAKQCLENVTDILLSAGSSPGRILKATIFLTNAEDLAAVNTAYAEFFKADYPARSCIVVAGLPHPQARVEIEVTAALTPRTPIETAI